MTDAELLTAIREVRAEVGRLLPQTTGPAGEQHLPAVERLWLREADLVGRLSPAERAKALAVPPLAVPAARSAGPADAAAAAGRQSAAEPTLIRVGVDDPLYVSRFKAYLRTGHRSAFAGLSTGSLQDGGYLAPPELVGGLTRGPDTLFFRDLANVRPPTVRPSVTRATRRSLATVLWQERLPAADGFQVGAWTLSPQWLSGQVITSRDIADRAGNEAVVMGELLVAAGRTEEAAFVAGDGVGKPLGVFSPSDQGVSTARDVTGAITSADVFIDALVSLPARHLRSASLRWLMHPTGYATLLKLKSTTGESVIEPGEGPAGQPTILGVPVELTDDAPAGTGGGGAYQAGDYLAAVGDLAAYDVQDGLDFGVQRFNDAPFNARNQVLFSFRRKVDGCPRLPEAFARVKLS